MECGKDDAINEIKSDIFEDFVPHCGQIREQALRKSGPDPWFYDRGGCFVIKVSDTRLSVDQQQPRSYFIIMNE